MISRGTGFACSPLGQPPAQVFTGQGLSRDTAAQTSTGEDQSPTCLMRQGRATLAQLRRNHSKSRANFARSCPNPPPNGSCSAEFGRVRPAMGRSARNGPSPPEFGRVCISIGQHRSNFAEIPESSKLESLVDRCTQNHRSKYGSRRKC